MKLHDHHVLLQQIFPVCLWHRMDKAPQDVMWICKVFKLICNKVYDRALHEVLKIGAMIMLCLLEIAFLPSFFWPNDAPGCTFNWQIGPLWTCPWLLGVSHSTCDERFEGLYEKYVQARGLYDLKVYLWWSHRSMHWIHVKLWSNQEAYLGC